MQALGRRHVDPKIGRLRDPDRTGLLDGIGQGKAGERVSFGGIGRKCSSRLHDKVACLSRPHRLTEWNRQHVTLDGRHEKLVVEFQGLHDVQLVKPDLKPAGNPANATDHPGRARGDSLEVGVDRDLHLGRQQRGRRKPGFRLVGPVQDQSRSWPKVSAQTSALAAGEDRLAHRPARGNIDLLHRTGNIQLEVG